MLTLWSVVSATTSLARPRAPLQPKWRSRGHFAPREARSCTWGQALGMFLTHTPGKKVPVMLSCPGPIPQLIDVLTRPSVPPWLALPASQGKQAHASPIPVQCIGSQVEAPACPVPTAWEHPQGPQGQLGTGVFWNPCSVFVVR